MLLIRSAFVNDDDDNDEELPPPSPSNINGSNLNSSNGNNNIGKIDLFNASTTDLTNQQQEEFNHSQQRYPDLKWWKLTLTNKSNKFIKSNHRSSTSSNSISSSSIQNNQQSQIHRNRSNDNRLVEIFVMETFKTYSLFLGIKLIHLMIILMLTEIQLHLIKQTYSKHSPIWLNQN